MIEVISSISRHLHEKTLDEMFQHRYRILVEGLGWSIPGQSGDREKDAYDTDDTIYIVDKDDNGQLLASIRLNPTTKPHLLSEVFCDHCELVGVPESANVWELSRAVYDYHKMDGTRFRFSRAAMRLAIVEFCQSVGIEKVSWLTKRDLFATISTFWPTIPLGGSKYCFEDNETYIAALSNLNEVAWNNSVSKYNELSSERLELAGYPVVPLWSASTNTKRVRVNYDRP